MILWNVTPENTWISCVGKEQEKLAKEAGFSLADHYELANGLMGVLVLRK